MLSVVAPKIYKEISTEKNYAISGPITTSRSCVEWRTSLEWHQGFEPLKSNVSWSQIVVKQSIYDPKVKGSNIATLLTLGWGKGKIKVCHRLTFLSFLSPSESDKILTKSNVSWSQIMVE
jgi:hypothetical protein